MMKAAMLFAWIYVLIIPHICSNVKDPYLREIRSQFWQAAKE